MKLIFSLAVAYPNAVAKVPSLASAPIFDWISTSSGIGKNWAYLTEEPFPKCREQPWGTEPISLPTAIISE